MRARTHALTLLGSTYCGRAQTEVALTKPGEEPTCVKCRDHRVRKYAVERERAELRSLINPETLPAKGAPDEQAVAY